jgi:hypothetical protein
MKSKKYKLSEVVFYTVILTLALVIPNMALAAPVPDTGQIKCYNNTVEIPCPQPGEPFYGQDAQYGSNTQSYTKLDATDNDLPTSATSWAMVRDNVTGLIWEEKHNKDSVINYADPNDADNTYTWYDGATGTPGNGTDTQDFINALNAQNYGGHQDWRLPTPKELSTLVDSSIPYPGPTINTSYFPDTVASDYWSSTTGAYNTDYAWYVDFIYGGAHGYGNKSYGNYVRAVCGGQSGAFDNLIINGDGTVTDTATGLMWQQNNAPGTYTWEQALTYCENLTLTDKSDWRLPNPNELQSIVDYNRYNPTIDTTLFPDTVAFNYWSATTYAGNTPNAKYVDFFYGTVNDASKPAGYYVRAVRGGQCGSTVINLSSFTGTPKAGKIILEWNTASEIDNAGFNIYRAQSENGEYAKLNNSLIPAHGSPTQGAAYEFTDTNVKNRLTYYYKLEDIDLNGTSTMHGPVKATPRWIYGF